MWTIPFLYVTHSYDHCFCSFHLPFGALALAVLVILCLANGYSAVSPLASNEINHKSNRFNYNYCEAGLCQSNKKHIGCVNKGHFGHTCTSDARVIELDDYSRRLILHMHNTHRSTIAEGKTPGYPPAVRMGALKWDDELAYLATLNAMSCEIEHDKCRNTRAFPFAGQNLALGWLLDDHTIDWAIRNFTSEWYIEYSDAHPSIVDAFYRPSGPAIGHFTLMVNDKQSKGMKNHDDNQLHKSNENQFISQSDVALWNSQSEWITTTTKSTFSHAIIRGQTFTHCPSTKKEELPRNVPLASTIITMVYAAMPNKSKEAFTRMLSYQLVRLRRLGCDRISLHSYLKLDLHLCSLYCNSI